MSAILTGLVVLVLLFPAAAADPPNPDIEMFTREGCPFCAAALVFLEELRQERPELRIQVSNVQEDPRALARLVELAEQHSLEHLGVPAFHVRGRLVVGFSGAQTTGAELKALLERPLTGSAGERPERDAGTSETIEVPLVGLVSVRDLGLPAFTVILGLLDGFNPCAMWVLLFVLSLLVNLRDRVKMAVIGGTFVLVSGIVYFAFMAAWLNLFLFVGVSRITQILLGLIAGIIGTLNVKDSIVAAHGPSLAIPASARPGIYARVRAVVMAEHLAPALGGVVVLAILVNIVELLCTAGFPAVYTRILTLRELPAWKYYAYLLLYNLAYVLDDGLMLTLAVVTLSRRKLQERAGRWLKLVSGSVMLGLGAVLIGRPAWLVW
ncbi:MAG TPA: glutaredoxin domain-containing protein [Candidatus Deferrimicrobiaceae bacterium]|nr:glutaredoxin domain-containing protein [Candidatus Deferrimicrobiaceae bacterium]